MKKLTFSTTALLLSMVLNATTIYYNGEGDDVGAWSIAPGGAETAEMHEVYDTTLNSTVMQFRDGATYRIRLPNNQLWANSTEKLLSFDMRLSSYYTIDIFVDTLDGVRALFYNGLNVHVGHHNQGILNAIGNGRTYMTNTTVWWARPGWGEEGGAPAFNRNGWVRVTLDLDRELMDTEPDNRVVRVLSMNISGTAGRIDNVSLTNPDRVTHASNAQDWSITAGVPAGGTIENHQENEARGNVVSFSGTATSNSYSTGGWNDTTHDILQWKMRTANNYKFIVHTTTANGARDLVYVTDRDDVALNENNEIGIGIGASRNGDGVAYGNGTDGRWQTMTRNIATDIAEFDNGNRLTSINGVTVIGTDGRTTEANMIASDILVDDIQLFSSPVPTLATGSAYQLHAWRLRMNSVRISFNDNSEGEAGFRYINTDTNEQLGVDLAPMNGVNSSGIAQIDGLTHSTTYNIAVQTFFTDGRASTLSEPLSITTLVDPNPDNGDNGNNQASAADNLHRWRLRDNSVRISFVDHANGETGFRYINADTNEVLGNQVPATAGTGTSSIGQINGLTAGTTYRISVETFFNNAEDTVTSQPIEFTTTSVAPDPDNGNNGGNNQASAANDLHRWRLRDNSVRISFVDHANGETGFRYINVDTGETLGNQLPATAGTGTASIGQINGLTAGTTYRISVETLFNDGQATATSEPIEFTTTGVAPDPDNGNNGENNLASTPANDLHRWRLRATSVRISFRDNSEGETEFRFINDATGVQMGNALPATANTGSASIGQINGLTANTTYTVRVHTLFNDGRATAISEPITFTTLAQ